MIRFIKPDLPPPERWLAYLRPAYQNHWFSNFGPVYELFARRLSECFGMGSRVAVPVANATAGLEAVLRALEIRGRVVVPSFTFAATAQAVLAAGATPLFCDVDPVSWELCPTALEELLSSRSANAVVTVRAFGLCRDLAPLESVCARHGVPLIVDSAAALGGSGPGIPVGHAGVAEIFSLHATKVFAIGEGGIVLCPPQLATPVRRAINFGFQDGDVIARGVNGKLSEFAAAIGLAALDELQRHIAARRATVDRYLQQLSPWLEKGIITAPHAPGEPPWQTLPLLLAPGTDAEALRRRCIRAGLELRRYYHPALHRTRLFRHYGLKRALPVTERLCSSMICMPVHATMKPSLIDAASALFSQALTDTFRAREPIYEPTRTSAHCT